MQKIIIALGDTVVASSIQQILRSLSKPGILDGFEFSAADTDLIGISPGVALADSGVLIIEDEIKTIQFTPTVQPGVFTIYYRYMPSSNFGGNAATMAMQAGTLDPETFDNGVILGWFRYPGASAPLSASMFISAPRMKLSAPVEKQDGVYSRFYPPFGYLLTRTASSGPFVTLSESYDGSIRAPVTTVQNTGVGVATAKYILPFTVPAYGLGRISAEFSVSAQASVRFSLLKKDGITVIQPLNQEFFINTPMGEKVMNLPQDLLMGMENETAYVQIELSLQSANAFVLRSLGISSYTEPL